MIHLELFEFLEQFMTSIFVIIITQFENTGSIKKFYFTGNLKTKFETRSRSRFNKRNELNLQRKKSGKVNLSLKKLRLF